MECDGIACLVGMQHKEVWDMMMLLGIWVEQYMFALNVYVQEDFAHVGNEHGQNANAIKEVLSVVQ